MTQKQVIPVRLGASTRSGAGGFTYRPPLVSVHLASDRDWSSERDTWPKHSATTYSALIDTGSDYCGLDQAVADEIEAKPFGNGVVHNWAGTEESVGIASIQIVIPPCIVFVAEVALSDFRGKGQQWDVVLGRDFLKNCRLLVDGPTARYHLEWRQ